MKYPARFVDDLKYLASWYKWTQEDKDEIKSMFANSPETVTFLSALAAAHRAGYNDPAGKSFMTLEQWCIDKGLPSPFTLEFSSLDLKEIDQMAIEKNKQVC